MGTMESTNRSTSHLPMTAKTAARNSGRASGRTTWKNRTANTRQTPARTASETPGRRRGRGGRHPGSVADGGRLVMTNILRGGAISSLVQAHGRDEPLRLDREDGAIDPLQDGLRCVPDQQAADAGAGDGPHD